MIVMNLDVTHQNYAMLQFYRNTRNWPFRLLYCESVAFKVIIWFTAFLSSRAINGDKCKPSTPMYDFEKGIDLWGPTLA